MNNLKLIFIFTFALQSTVWGTTSEDPYEDVSEEGRRVVEGTLSPVIPFMIKLSIQGGSSVAGCGASLLTPNGAVTAAHCIQNCKGMNIYLGATKKFEGLKRQIHGCKVHPKFDAAAVIYDIGVIFWKDAVSWTKDISPIAIGPEPRVGTEVELAGYGRMANNKPSEGLRTVKVTIKDINICKSKLKNQKRFSDYPPGALICVFEDPFKGCNTGDSGGPMYIMKDKPVLLGIMSMEACQLGINLFVSASHFSHWIMDTIKCLKEGGPSCK